MLDLILSNIFMTLYVVALLIGFAILLNYIIRQKVAKKKVEFLNNSACKQALKEHNRRLYLDYFWSDHMRFAWIALFLLFFIALGLALKHPVTITVSILLVVVSFYFVRFAIRSYKAFPEIAAQRLKKFEEEVENIIKNEISFKGDNIQVFSEKDNHFDTNPIIFSFPTSISKIDFPPFEKNPAKQPIINTRKLEFLVLSREYFSICKNAATFNLLNPDRAPVPKQCAELPGRAGECHEHYYSHMRNVEYDDTKECIRIIYEDARDDVEFPCKKNADNRQPAMKALQEKLRLTERQKLRKIDEHEKFENILSRRDDSSEIPNATE